MRAGIACLVVAYVLSQFYRSCLAVLSPVLRDDLGAGAGDLAAASGLWFLAFAGMQLPVGAALDRIGPRRTASVSLTAAAAGAAVFALAEGPGAIKVAMVLIGIGCSPVLMAGYYIFARSLPAAMFGTLAGMMVGIGSLGNLAAAAPLAVAVEAVGWRASMWVLAGVTLGVAGVLAMVLRDPPRVAGGPAGRLIDLLAMRALWPVLVMMAVCYAPAAGLRGLWLGPYFTDVFGADAGAIGVATLVMGLAMVVGTFVYGPLDRLLGTRKGVVIGGNLLAAACLMALALGTPGQAMALALLAGVGFFGASFPMVIAHGRAFLPPHLVGRGVTLLNLFGIGAVGLAQGITGRIHVATDGGAPGAPYAAICLFFGICLLAGLAIYATSRDRTD